MGSRSRRPVAIVGPTASGKSSAALELARRAGGVELVAVDSMQVYRGMDIGTAKPTAAEQAEVPHHLIDLAEPDDDFTVARYQRAFDEATDAIAARGATAVLVGGTALYLRAVVDRLTIPGRWPDVRAALDADDDTAGLHRRLAQLDPLAASRMEATNRRRVIRALEVTLGSGRPFSSFGPGLDAHPPTPIRLVAMDVDRDELDDRIGARFEEMLDAGLVDEVRTLAPRLGRTARQALGYKEVLAHIEHGMPLDAAIEEAVRRTRKFARRQLAWFRRDPRIEWVKPVALVDTVLGDWTAACP